MTRTPTACVVTTDRLPHQRPWHEAFALGLRRHGWQVTIGTTWRPSDLLIVWGVRRVHEMERQRAHGGAICVLERGYVGDRFKWTSVSFGGGLNGRGQFRGPFDDGSRWQSLFCDLMQPWRPDTDGEVLICGQVPGDASIAGVDAGAFYARARAAFEAQGHRVRFRFHPGDPRSRNATRTLAEDLATARCVVTWNSNSGVDAVLAGVPAVVMDAGGMAYPVAAHRLELPPMPDRTRWAHRLAWCQWNEGEMQSGACWEAVGAGLAVAA